jgi:hypothetical protein
LLTRAHAGRRPTEPIARPAAHFGNDEDIPVTGHDVQLAQTAEVIALQDLKTLGSEEIGGELFSRGAQKLVCGPAAGGTP